MKSALSKHGIPAFVLLLALVHSATAATFVPAKADGFVGLWYGYTDGRYYAGGLGTFPQQIHPMAYYAADAGKSGRTFFVYGGATQADPTDLLTMISYYDHAAKQVARPRILNHKGTNDGHDNPSLMLDGKGYIYVFSNAHGTLRPSFLYRSTRPYSLDEFETVLTLPKSNNFSYAQPWYVPGQGFLLLHSNYGAKPIRRLYYNSSVDGVHWRYDWNLGGANPRPGLALMPGGCYQVSGMHDRTVGTAFNVSVDNDRRTNLYYVETSDLGRAWKTAAGDAISTPITKVDSAALVHDYKSAGLYVFLKEVRYDAAGEPVLLYLTSSTVDTNDLKPPRTWHTARFDAAAHRWVIRRAFTSDNNYDFGTLYIEGDGAWRIIASTEPGPQAGKTGGEMAVWISRDRGTNWRKTLLLTHDSKYNHTYPRQPVNANADFYAFWADGDASPKVSLSSLYFTDKAGSGVWRLPTTMTGEFAAPELAGKPISAADEKPTSWWEAETALDRNGRLLLTGKPWWRRAAALKVGEHFSFQSTLPGGGRMIVRRERLVFPPPKSKTVDALVWIIDDDGDMRPADADGDRDSDCYVVDYDGDGKSDQIVDYMDNDGDGRADEMDMRYFADGQLRMAWFSTDLDRDGRMWNAAWYKYVYTPYSDDDPNHVDPYDASGDAEIIVNKYDPEQRRWWPASECPFAWYDTDGDGATEEMIRAAVVPRLPYPPAEIDGGNTHCNTRPFEPRFRDTSLAAIRYCIDLTGSSSAKHRVHYDLGLNMTGDRTPYRFEGMERTNPLRRRPKTIICIPHRALRALADKYPANQTGLSWFEFPDDTVSIGCLPREDKDRHPDGVCWTWDRRYMHDTGGPTQYWNIRREFRPSPSDRRELYYSVVDRRIHLKGATEGWTRVGHLGGGGKPWGEVRAFDTDGDGYFDRWETYRDGTAAPVRVATVRDQRVRSLPHDWKELQTLFTGELLPEAIRANEKLIAALRAADGDFHPPGYLEKALEQATFDTERLYVLGIIRESRYLAVRDKLAARQQKLLASARPDDTKRDRGNAPSVRAWESAVSLTKLDAAYGEGRYDKAAKILKSLVEIMKMRELQNK